MNTRRWMLIASFLVGSMAASGFPAVAAEAPPPVVIVAPPPPVEIVAPPPPVDVIVQPCGGFFNALFGCYRPYPYYYGGPLSGATHAHYFGSNWPRSQWRRERDHRFER